MKKRMTLYLEEELVKKAKKSGLNISRICEIALEEAIRNLEASKEKETRNHSLFREKRCPGRDLNLGSLAQEGVYYLSLTLNEVYVSRKLREIEEYEEGIDRRLKKLGEHIERRIRKFRVMDFTPHGRVVDFGTGIGLDLISLHRLCNEIELVGVDISFEGLKKAKELMSKEGKEFHPVRADVLFPPFRDKVFDAVNFSNVLHHHPFSLLEKIMAEVDRISKKNSLILVSEPSDPNEPYEFSWEINRIWNGVKDLEKLSMIYDLKDLRRIGYDLHVLGYYGYIYPSILKRLLEKYGFKIRMRFVSESLRIDEIIEELKKKVESLNLDKSVKDYLTDRLIDIKRKSALISPLYNFQLYVKAVRE